MTYLSSEKGFSSLFILVAMGIIVLALATLCWKYADLASDGSVAIPARDNSSVVSDSTREIEEGKPSGVESSGNSNEKAANPSITKKPAYRIAERAIQAAKKVVSRKEGSKEKDSGDSLVSYPAEKRSNRSDSKTRADPSWEDIDSMAAEDVDRFAARSTTAEDDAAIGQTVVANPDTDLAIAEPNKEMEDSESVVDREAEKRIRNKLLSSLRKMDEMLDD